MAGNPDQQEDTLDDQYQEEVEDEVCNSSDALETNMQSMSPVDPLCVTLLSRYRRPEGSGGHSWRAEARGGGGGGGGSI